jgi:type I restriction enzyme S subunit
MSSEIRFADLMLYAIGGGWGSEGPEEDTTQVAVIRGTDIPDVGFGNIDGLPIRHEKTSKAAKRFLLPGDIVVEISGGSAAKGQTTGRSALITEQLIAKSCLPLIPASFCRLLRLDADLVDPRFAYYALQDMYKSGRAGEYENQSTGISNFRFNDFLDQEVIRICDRIQQEAIAHILGTLDDKIELNRKTNETLEAMARALFKSWFVDFDPVRAKAEGRPTGLPDEISDLFPDSFEDSELGEIPRGWQVKALDEIAHFLNGLALQKFPSEDGIPTLPVIKIAQLKKGDVLGADRCSASLPEDYVIKDGDVLFSWSGSLAVDIWCGGDGALNQHLFKVTSKTYGKWFFYQWVKHHLPDFQEIAQGKATTMGHIQRHHLSEAQALIPTPSLLGAMDSVFASMLDRSFVLRKQSRELSSIRDNLLPKLISGELRIPEAERLLEEAGV